MSEKQSLIKLIFFQDVDRSAVLVCITALEWFCNLTDISVHGNQMYKSKTQTCEAEKGGSLQAFGSLKSYQFVWRQFIVVIFGDTWCSVKCLGLNVGQHFYQSVSLQHCIYNLFKMMAF